MQQTRACDPNCTRECVCPSGPVDREATRGGGMAQPARYSLEESNSPYNIHGYNPPPSILRWSDTSRFVTGLLHLVSQ